MRSATLYLDSSVLGGYFDDEFKEATRELFRQLTQGKFRALTSVVVKQEIMQAPAAVRNLMQTTFPDQALLPLETEALDLADAYVREGVVVPKYLTDARHVAICTVARLDYLVSWNFRHMVNVHREAGFSAVNLLQGYRRVRIVSPLELIYGQEKEDV